MGETRFTTSGAAVGGALMCQMCDDQARNDTSETQEPCPYCDTGCRECGGIGFVQPREEYRDPRDAEDWKRHAE